MSMMMRRSQNLSILVRGNAIFLIWRLLHNGPDTLEELLERHVVQKKQSLDEDEEELLTQRQLNSTRREALKLYRDILRASRFFLWRDSHGVLWRDILRENARKEFEQARFEKDPEIVTRLLTVGHDAVESALEKLVEKRGNRLQRKVVVEIDDHCLILDT